MGCEGLRGAARGLHGLLCDAWHGSACRRLNALNALLEQLKPSERRPPHPAEDARAIFLLELPPDERGLQEGGGSHLKAAGPAAKDLEAGGDDSSDYRGFWIAAAATKAIPLLELGNEESFNKESFKEESFNEESFNEESFDEPPPWMDNSFAETEQSMLPQICGLGGPSASSMGAPAVEGMATLQLAQEGQDDDAAPGNTAPGSSGGSNSALHLRPPAPAGPRAAQGDAGPSSGAGASGASDSGERQLSWQRSGSSSSSGSSGASSAPLLTRQLRPPNLTQGQMLRLLAEAYGQMVLSPADNAAVELTDAQLEVWLAQLLGLMQHGKRDTVLALHDALKRQHAWVKLGDVYSALVYLRDELLRRSTWKQAAGSA